MLSRREEGESGKTERKAGSRRGVVAVEMREGFLRRRWGDLGPTVAVGETGSLSEDDLRRLWRDRSVWEMILRRGGLRAISFDVPFASRTMPSPPGSATWVEVAITVSQMKMVESAATVTSRDVLQLSSAGSKATSVMPSVCPQSLAMSDPYSVYIRTDLSELATPAIAGLPLSDGA